MNDQPFLQRLFQNILGSKKVSFSSPQEKIAPALNNEALSSAIAYNETAGVKDNPYQFSRPSGVKSLGNAIGKYQITQGELDTWSPKFLGSKVDEETFKRFPGLQDTYMREKANYLNTTYGWGPDKIIAAHRGGFGEPEEIDRIMKEHQSYVDQALNNYNNYKQVNLNK